MMIQPTAATGEIFLTDSKHPWYSLELDKLDRRVDRLLPDEKAKETWDRPSYDQLVDLMDDIEGLARQYRMRTHPVWGPRLKLALHPAYMTRAKLRGRAKELSEDLEQIVSEEEAGVFLEELRVDLKETLRVVSDFECENSVEPDPPAVTPSVPVKHPGATARDSPSSTTS